MLTRFRYATEDMVPIIHATQPFGLGDIDLAGNFSPQEEKMLPSGFMLLWPLHVARASTNKGSKKESWIRGGLSDSYQEVEEDTLALVAAELTASR